MKDKVNRKVFVYNHIFTLGVSIIMLIMVELFNNHAIVPIALITCGCINIISIYVKEKLLMNPLTIFSLIWLILIPISSYEYPVMREMTDFEWKIVLIFIMCFSIGGIIASQFKRNIKDRKYELYKGTLTFNYIVLLISTFSLIIMFIKFGGIPLFYSDANVGKDLFRNSSILNTLTYFGTGSIILYILEEKHFWKSKKTILLSCVYIILLILSAERYFVSILIISCIYSYCKKKIDHEFLKKILISVLSILTIFIVILQFRGNSSQKQIYFIDSGIYSGTAKELTSTEIFRYLGMQERILTKTFDNIEPGISRGTLTFSPLLKLININPINIPDVQIYGYTSKSIITKLYCDFGYLWWVAMIILSIIINLFYKEFSKRKSYTNQYFTIIWLVFLTFSFYAYFDNLIIFYLHIPLYIKLMEILNANWGRKNESYNN